MSATWNDFNSSDDDNSIPKVRSRPTSLELDRKRLNKNKGLEATDRRKKRTTARVQTAAATKRFFFFAIITCSQLV